VTLIASGRQGWLAGHIPGSRHVDLAFELTDATAGYHFAHLPPGELAARAGDWGLAAQRSFDVAQMEINGYAGA
jgi:3-mercaptopyruvate sulfurtransferase SseA